MMRKERGGGVALQLFCSRKMLRGTGTVNFFCLSGFVMTMQNCFFWCDLIPMVSDHKITREMAYYDLKHQNHRYQIKESGLNITNTHEKIILGSFDSNDPQIMTYRIAELPLPLGSEKCNI